LRRIIARPIAVALLVVSCRGGGTPTTVPSTTAAGATTPPSTAQDATTTTLSDDPVATDGTTVTADTIHLGILADLSGPRSADEVDSVDAQVAFWTRLNEAGGIADRQVELMVIDVGAGAGGLQAAYGLLAGRVAMFSHIASSPQETTLAADLADDGLLAVAGSGYSGWSDPQLGAGILEVGSNNCLEAMNAVGFIAAAHQEELGVLPTVAIATDQGPYGQDSAAGARYAADQLGLSIVFDAEGQILTGGELEPIAAGIAAGAADYTWLATDPESASTIVSAAVAQGYDGAWSGAAPSFGLRLLDGVLGEYLTASWTISLLHAPIGADVAGMAEVYDVLAEVFPGRLPTDALVTGYLEYAVTSRILERAAEDQDLTPQGLMAAAGRVGEVGFGGISPPNRYAGVLDDSVARATSLYRPSKELFDAQGGLAATFAAGAVAPYTPLQDLFVSDVAAGYDFQQPCHLEGG
jgi:ABC-type branched-subunit amino acid transport system substrate-binding protein